MPTFSSRASARAMASARGSFRTWTGDSMTFCSTVMCAHRLKLWNTMPRRERMRSTWRWSCGTAWPSRVGRMRISSPLTSTSPVSGVSSRLMQRSSVLLPDPLEPIIAMTSPSLAASEIPFSTSRSPNRLCRSLTTRAGIAGPIALDWLVIFLRSPDRRFFAALSGVAKPKALFHPGRCRWDKERRKRGSSLGSADQALAMANHAAVASRSIEHRRAAGGPAARLAAGRSAAGFRPKDVEREVLVVDLLVSPVGADLLQRLVEGVGERGVLLAQGDAGPIAENLVRLVEARPDE